MQDPNTPRRRFIARNLGAGIFFIALSDIVSASAADEREAEYAALRQKIEKKIGAEKLQTLDKLGSTISNKWTEWDNSIGSAQRYFRGGRIGTEEEKQLLIRAYMKIKWSQGFILQSDFHNDPEWRKLTQAFFDLVVAHDGLKKILTKLEELTRCDDRLRAGNATCNHCG